VKLLANGLTQSAQELAIEEVQGIDGEQNQQGIGSARDAPRSSVGLLERTGC
jgi:hypothetical protein